MTDDNSTRYEFWLTEVLLDSGATYLVMSLEFIRKQRFKLKIEKLIYVKNIDSTSNKDGPIEYLLQRA